jgi:VanZ family protein
MFLLYTAYHQLGCLFPDNYMELQCGANSADTLNHVAVFAALAAPIAAFYPGALRWAVPVLVVSGGVAEIVQPFIGRTASSMDFLANFCGVFIGVCAGRIVWRWRGSNAYGWR